jgi:LmbE family N-acetylglucosaminyl deacetylase
VIGAGGQLHRLIGAAVLHVTDGAPRELGDAQSAGFAGVADYAKARKREAEMAMALAGIPSDRIFCLEIPDQETTFRLTALSRGLHQFFDEHDSRVVVTHAYEGGHPDHDAVSFAVNAACRRIAGGRRPKIIEMAGYHAGPEGLVTNDFLQPSGPTLTLMLDAGQQESKRRMLACYRTQAATLAPFGVSVERLRPAPLYDYGKPPHPGQLWYEQFGWALSGEGWRARARAALHELGLDEAGQVGP